MVELPSRWERRRMLVLGMTYPSYSRTYGETVCTGVVFEDDHTMARLHPMPQRYLEPGKRVGAFKLIEADVTKSEKDTRPETYRVRPDSIVIVKEIKDSEERHRWLTRSPHWVQSYEAMTEAWNTSRQSLGIMEPKDILSVAVEPKPPGDAEVWREKEQVLLQQDFFRELKPIAYVPVRFKVRFNCDDLRCVSEHDCALQVWGIHELWRRLEGDPKRVEKVEKEMWKRLRKPDSRTVFFLGNFDFKKFNFGLMDSTIIPAQVQGDLFK